MYSVLTNVHAKKSLRQIIANSWISIVS